MSAPAQRPHASAEPLDLVLDGVSHTYLTEGGDSVTALDRIDLTIPRGQFVCMVGPSGCGKTTLLRLLAGFIDPPSGQARAGGVPIKGPDARRGVVFQASTLFPWFSVRHNVELGLRYRGVPADERRRLADEHLALVGLSDYGHLRPTELSGGMQQRCQIARVLANSPGVVLMDEPFGALDALTRARLQDDLRRIQNQRSNTVFFITHSVEEAVYLADRVLVMSQRPGRILLDVAVDLPAERDDHVRSTPEFLRLRDQVANAIEE